MVEFNPIPTPIDRCSLSPRRQDDRIHGEWKKRVNALDELLLILGGGVDRRALLLLLLIAAAGSEVGTAEQGAEDGHRKLYHRYISSATGLRVNWR